MYAVKRQSVDALPKLSCGYRVRTTYTAVVFATTRRVRERERERGTVLRTVINPSEISVCQSVAIELGEVRKAWEFRLVFSTRVYEEI